MFDLTEPKPASEAPNWQPNMTADDTAGKCCAFMGTFACSCGRYVASEAKGLEELERLLCWAYDNLSDMPISEEWADKWCKEFRETAFAKDLLGKPAASSAAGPERCDHGRLMDERCWDYGCQRDGGQEHPPARFIAKENMVPPRGHDGRGGDQDQAFSWPHKAEQEQAGELPELPEPEIMSIIGNDGFTADQMHAYARAALLRRAARVEVDEAMVERACRVVAKCAGEELDVLDQYTRSVLMDTQHAALTAALEPGK